MCAAAEGGREGAWAARAAQLCAPASLGSKLLAPGETRCLCGARGGTPAGTPRASSPSSSIPRREGAGPGRGGARCSALRRGRFPGARGAAPEQGARRRAGRCQKAPQHCRPPAQLGPRRSLPSAALPVPPTPPVRGFSRPPGGVPTPRSPPLSPLPPQGNASFHPSQAIPFLHGATCEVPVTPASRPVPNAKRLSPFLCWVFPRHLPGSSPGCPIPGWLLRPSGVRRNRRGLGGTGEGEGGVDVTQLQTLRFSGPGGACSGAFRRWDGALRLPRAKSSWRRSGRSSRCRAGTAVPNPARPGAVQQGGEWVYPHRQAFRLTSKRADYRVMKTPALYIKIEA